ncbi:RimJ/RimL family protein N-acetyltransferase [Thermocatellispora tengchongensis]|uniref:RimJ/RimL family protein N-acetyltransferase n=1 Tax=Thermocatellispora tengchongensis TaxID=1073253 RepID=A0A840NZ29_9ACTN|nr:GNAT family protein [Thermocatellispora tengchongensis]MBB5130390.1 RimJ/RimL family protein N-acetyltransferase [Thermocatellispora tengchongensis]
MPALVTLSGRSVRLEPLSLAAIDELVAAASEDRSTYRFTRVPATREEMVSYVEAAQAEQAEGRCLPFAIRWLSTDTIVGATRLMHLEYWQGPMPWPPGTRGAVGEVPSVADIGYTWLAASAQRTGVNLESKLLLLSHAFETWQVHRISLKADVRNTRSRAAIEALGAHFDGVRRADSRGADDTVRDTAYYSILNVEWPAVRDRMLGRLGWTEAA